MPVADLPFTYTVKKPNGKVYWRFRRGETRAALPGKPGDPAFHARYAELIGLSQRVAQGTSEKSRDSLSWLIERYQAGAEFKALRDRTRQDYEQTLDLIDREMGPEPYRLITRKMIKVLRDEHSATPRKAHKIKQMMSALYTWAQGDDLVDDGHNPAAGIRRLKVRQQSIPAWSEEEIDLFLPHCPPELLTPFLLALYTGQRAQDVVIMDWSACVAPGKTIRVRQSKTGEPLDIACHDVLRQHLNGIRTNFGGVIARSPTKRPYSPMGFAQHIRRTIEKIRGQGIAFPDRSPHGLRYAAAGRMEEAGVTPADAACILGHRTYQMAMKYLSARKRGAEAMMRVENKA